MTLELGGMHHLTAITAHARENLRFYTQVLGLRLVKKTVNQDDVSAYHLFYGDGAASPGSDITFFDWPAAPEVRGTGSIVRTSFRVAGASLPWWRKRLLEAAIWSGDVVERDGRATLLFEDAEGQRLALIDDGGAGEAHAWARSPVPPEHQVRGLGPVCMSIARLSRSERLLTEGLGMRKTREFSDPDRSGSTMHAFEMGRGGPAAELYVVEEPGVPMARQGAGGAHHVAFRARDRAELAAWNERLTGLGYRTSGEVERYYFRSLYLREPGGVLFEIATDGPGFAVDEPLERLGEKLSLPPFLEGRRAEIERGLKGL
jgi:glyoxalase family protein